MRKLTASTSRSSEFVQKTDDKYEQIVKIIEEHTQMITKLSEERTNNFVTNLGSKFSDGRDDNEPEIELTVSSRCTTSLSRKVRAAPSIPNTHRMMNGFDYNKSAD